MNASNAKDYLLLVQALADGKVIQGYFEIDQKWRDLVEVRFDAPLYQYRIKPEPREIWVNEYPCGDEHIHENPVNAANALRDNGITRHYREVIE